MKENGRKEKWRRGQNVGTKITTNKLLVLNGNEDNGVIRAYEGSEKALKRVLE